LSELLLELRDSIGENPVATLKRLVDLSLKLNDISSAEKYLDRAFESARLRDEAGLLYRRALVAKEKGDLLAALSWCEQALEKYTEMRQKRGIRRSRRLKTKLLKLTDRDQRKDIDQPDEEKS
jgi:tetratricopeptide (TPR) repeat protein